MTDLSAVLRDLLARTPESMGVLAAVRLPDGTTRTGAAGVRDVATGEPLTSDATFRIASVTKTFTAATTLRLVERGDVGIDDAVASHLPAELVAIVRGGGHPVDDITVRQLLSHTSGLPDYATMPSFAEAVLGDPGRRWTRAEQVEWAMTHGAPVDVPGARYHYSDAGYILLGALLEQRVGGTLAEAYRALLPMDRLPATHLETIEPVPPGAGPRTHQYIDDIDIWDLHPSQDLYGGGGLMSSTEDLAAFYAALLVERSVLSPESLDVMLAPSTAVDGAGMGMGIFRFPIDTGEWWGHTGFWGVCGGADVTTGIAAAAAVLQRPAFPADGSDVVWPLHPYDVVQAAVSA